MKPNPYILIKSKIDLKTGSEVHIYSTPFSIEEINKKNAKKLMIEDLHNGLIPEDKEHRFMVILSDDRLYWNMRFTIEK